MSLSQAAFAARVGVNEMTVSRWERGAQTPDMDHLERISDLGNITVQDLLGDTSNGDGPKVQLRREELVSRRLDRVETEVREIRSMLQALIARIEDLHG